MAKLKFPELGSYVRTKPGAYFLCILFNYEQSLIKKRSTISDFTVEFLKNNDEHITYNRNNTSHTENTHNCNNQIIKNINHLPHLII